MDFLSDMHISSAYDENEAVHNFTVHMRISAAICKILILGLESYIVSKISCPRNPCALFVWQIASYALCMCTLFIERHRAPIM